MLIRDVRRTDSTAIHEMLADCGAFTEEEVRVALDLVDEGLIDAGGYVLFAAEKDGEVCGYVCIGKTPLTLSTWHLYWICVHPRRQRTGVGRALQKHVETWIRQNGGERLVLETSSLPGYNSAHRFYEERGYREVGRIRDYYKPGDDCIMFCKEFVRDETGS